MRARITWVTIQIRVRVITVVKMLWTHESQPSDSTIKVDLCDDAHLLWIRVQTTLNHIRFVLFCFFFYHNIKDNERNLSQYLLPIENTDSDLMHALHYAKELLVRVRLSFQETLAKSLNMQQQYEKYCLGKE